MSDLSRVLLDVRDLLDAPPGTEPAPRAVVEDTLTTGYAYALDLESERLRIERRLRSLLTAGGRARAEIVDLTGRREQLERELASVRSLLSSLRAQALA